ncbi:MAG: DMT family transporter [Rhodobacter sp.]|nr:DMT family transporter [Rhodobacter sp.]
MALAEAHAGLHRPGLGIALMLAAWFLFSLVDTSVKWLVIAGLPAAQLSFMRYLGHFAISVARMGQGGFRRARFRVRHPGLVIARALLLVSATAFNFYVLKYLPLTITSAIMFSAPIIVCLLSWPVLGERVGPWRWFAIMLGFGGVMVVIRPFDAGFQWAALVPLYNAFALALYSIITRRLAGIEPVETLQFYMGAIGTVILLPFAFAGWQNPGDTRDWLLFVALGLWAWGGHELLIRAHGMAPANTLMPYTYSFIIYLSITSYLVFAHVPDIWTMVGAAIIAGSGLIIWARENRQ